MPSVDDTHPADDAGASCSTCHQDKARGGHPVDFVSKRSLPVGFPLGAGGRFACLTCHDLGRADPDHVRADNRGRALCISCHDEGFFAAMSDGGQSLFVSPHLPSNKRIGTGLDPVSAQCLGCHDPEAIVASNEPGFGPLPHFVGPASHPIGRSYADAATYGGYRAIDALASDIVLPNGMVGCVSCHVPFSRDHARPPRTRSGLCVECHEM